MANLNTTKVTTYNTADSPATWTKDARTKFVKLFIWGGGGGGGSGRQGLTTVAGGGGGGGGGSTTIWEGPASVFGATESIVIGAGGAGGASQAGANTNGNPGGNATTSSFGNLSAVNGIASIGGTATSAAGGIGAESVSTFHQVQAINGGGAGTNTVGAASQNGSIAQSSHGFGTTSGGGGGGADSVVIRTGGVGGGYVGLDGSTVIQTPAAGGIESGTINGTSGGNLKTSGGVTIGGFGGGGGGGQSAGGVAGIGGAGGFPGGGGGGGGGSLNGTNSGAGGSGGNGQVIVIEYF